MQSTPLAVAGTEEAPERGVRVFDLRRDGLGGIAAPAYPPRQREPSRRGARLWVHFKHDLAAAINLHASGVASLVRLVC